MHAIRSAARKQAWYHNNDDDNRTYNFFGRYNANPHRRHDVEHANGSMQPLDHSMTENDAASPIETRRRADFHSAGDDFDGPKKAGTFPEGPSGNRPRDRAPPDEPAVIEESDDKTKNSTFASDTTKNPSTVPTGFTDQTVGKNDGTRKRRKFHLPFTGKKKEEEDVEKPARANTDKSKSKKKNHPKLTVASQIKSVFASWINILLVFVPVGIAVEFAKVNGVIVFIMNFIAIVPLAAMLSYATEEVAYYVGDTFGGLLNATFGNATELIVSIIALSKKEILIVQTSLIGSMLSNLLLVMGMCFFLGGINRVEQFFNITVAQTAASLLALAIGGLVMPTAFRIFSPDDAGVTPTSRATSVLLLLVYICYLVFQLRTHIDMYNEPSPKSMTKKAIKKKENREREAEDFQKGITTIGTTPGASYRGGKGNEKKTAEQNNGNALEKETQAEGSNRSDDDDDEEDDHVPQLTLIGGLIVLAISTALIAVTSDGMVSGIPAISESVSQEFTGLILIPIVGNAAEHATAVTVAIKDKMDLAIGVAVGSSLQIALLVVPIMVIIGWCGLGRPEVMDLNFDGFQVVVLFISIILVNYVIQDGKSHWLEGVMLMTIYIIIATAAWYYPATAVPT